MRNHFARVPVIYPIALKFCSNSCLLLVIRSHYIALTNTPNDTLSHLHPSFSLEFINLIKWLLSSQDRDCLATPDFVSKDLPLRTKSFIFTMTANYMIVYLLYL